MVTAREGNGYTIAPQCYVIWILPIFLNNIFFLYISVFVIRHFLALLIAGIVTVLTKALKGKESARFRSNVQIFQSCYPLLLLYPNRLSAPSVKSVSWVQSSELYNILFLLIGCGRQLSKIVWWFIPRQTNQAHGAVIAFIYMFAWCVFCVDH